jgi:hypothetical protein
MSSSGSPYARFRRALTTGNLALVRAAAAELPRVDLGDALCVCVLLRDREPERFERAAVRWLGRFCVERPDATIDEVQRAAGALRALGSNPEDALAVLQELAG